MKPKIIVFLLLLLVVPAFSSDKFLTEYRYALSGIGFGQQKLSFLSPVFYNAFSIVETKGKVKTTSKRIISSASEINFDFNLEPRAKLNFGVVQTGKPSGKLTQKI